MPTIKVYQRHHIDTDCHELNLETSSKLLDVENSDGLKDALRQAFHAHKEKPADVVIAGLWYIEPAGSPLAGRPQLKPLDWVIQQARTSPGNHYFMDSPNGKIPIKVYETTDDKPKLETWSKLLAERGIFVFQFDPLILAAVFVLIPFVFGLENGTGQAFCFQAAAVLILLHRVVFSTKVPINSGILEKTPKMKSLDVEHSDGLKAALTQTFYADKNLKNVSIAGLWYIEPAGSAVWKTLDWVIQHPDNQYFIDSPEKQKKALSSSWKKAEKELETSMLIVHGVVCASSLAASCASPPVSLQSALLSHCHSLCPGWRSRILDMGCRYRGELEQLDPLSRVAVRVHRGVHGTTGV